MSTGLRRAIYFVCSLLWISGYGLYYTADRFHDVASFIHEIVGAAAIGFALTHWWRNSQRVQS